MRSVVLSNRIRCLNSVGMFKILAMGLVGVLAAGCSSDVTRFDRQLYAALPQAKPNAYEQAVAANQSYPGDVDRTTTASIGGSGVPKPLSAVSNQSTPDHAGYATNNAPQPTYQAPALAQRQPLNAPVRYSQPTPNSYKPAPTYNSGVIKSALPKPTALPKPVSIPKPNVSALPKPTIAASPSVAAAKTIVTDQVQTNSIKATNVVKTEAKKIAAKQVAPVATKVAPVAAKLAPAVGAVNGGWSGVGGTTIQMRSGETLYNLSKRYGVPVSEIMRANSIANVSELKAGQSILIPTYVYSQNAPVSAPDSNPDTRAARSSTGLLGQPKDGNVPLPTFRPQQHAGLSPTDQGEAAPARRYKPKRSAAEPEGQKNPPDYSIVTGSIAKPALTPRISNQASGGQHIVQAGDSLGKIARQYGVSIPSLQQSNGISGSMIRLGQKLTIPNANVIKTSSVKQIPAGVDPIITGTTTKPVLKAPTAPKPYVKPTVDKTIATGAVAKDAPKLTGIKSLRWPVKGRVISAFGSKNDGIDISVPEGTSVKAAENGVVIYSGNELAGFGNLVLVRHADGIVTAYAHNKSNAVAKGSKVKRGQVIAKSGRTGNTETPKLHFEVRKNSKPVNPIPYLGG